MINLSSLQDIAERQSNMWEWSEDLLQLTFTASSLSLWTRKISNACCLSWK